MIGRCQDGFLNHCSGTRGDAYSRLIPAIIYLRPSKSHRSLLINWDLFHFVGRMNFLSETKTRGVLFESTVCLWNNFMVRYVGR